MKLITTCTNPSFDSIAAAFAAGLLCGGEAEIVLPDNLDKPQRNFLSMHFSNDDYSFASEHDNFNDVSEVILICAKSVKRIPFLSALLENPNVFITVYDKSPSIACEIQADSVIEAEYGAVTTLLCEKLFEKKIAVSGVCATLFALGTHEITGAFLYPNTKINDILCFSKLFEAGANLSVISAFSKDKLSEIQAALLQDLLKSRQVVSINGVDINLYTSETQKFIYKFDHIIQNIAGAEKFNISLFIVKMSANVYISARNNMDEINIGEIFKSIGGSGPRYAAFATMTHVTVNEAVSKVKSLLKKYIIPRLTAQNIMNKPVLFLNPETLIREAERILFRYGFSAMPLLQNNKVIGIIRKSDLDRAVHHGLSNAPVSSLIYREVFFVEPNESFENIKIKMSQNELKYILVGNEYKVLGTITRTDVLNYIFDRKKDLRHGSPYKVFSGESRKKLKSLKSSDVKVPLEKYFTREVMEFFKSISKIAFEQKASVYVVGGIVRDIILNKPSLDIDIVVEGMSGIKFAEAVVSKPEYILCRHDKFKTATIQVPGLPKIDFATARSEFYETPAALPDVFQSNLYQDLLRRDFTINALAVSLNRDSFGLLVDYYGGWEDINSKKIKILHGLSFIEDPTRIFRAMRFKNRLNFKLERNTEHKIREAVKYDVVQKVDLRRILNELELIFNEKKVYEIICELDKYGLLEFISRDIVFTEKIRKILKAAPRWIEKAASLFDGEKPSKTIIYLAILLLGVSLEKVPDLLLSSYLSKSERDRITGIVNKMLEVETEFQKISASKKRNENLSAIEVYNVLNGLTAEFLIVFLAIADNNKAYNAVCDYVNNVSKIKIEICGDNLKKLGIKPGPAYSKILQAVKLEKIARGFSDISAEIEYADKYVKTMRDDDKWKK